MWFERLSSELWNLRYVFLFRIIKCPCALIVFVLWIHNCESHVTIFTSLHIFGETIEKCQLPRLVQSVSGVWMEKSRPLKPTELANRIWGVTGLPDCSDAREKINRITYSLRFRKRSAHLDILFSSWSPTSRTLKSNLQKNIIEIWHQSKKISFHCFFEELGSFQ